MTTPADLERASADPIRTPYLTLVEVWPERSPSDVLYVVINNEDITSNGQVYTKGDIAISHPSASDGDISVQVVVSNIDRVLGKRLLAEKDRLIIKIMEINSAEPDTILRTTHDLFYLSGAGVDAELVSGELRSRLDMSDPYQPGVQQNFFPAL